MDEAIQKVSSILDEFNPTILVCATDNIALGAIKAAHLKGIKIPSDLSVTGFGGYDVTEIIHPALTTAKFYYKEAGEMAKTKYGKAFKWRKNCSFNFVKV